MTAPPLHEQGLELQLAFRSAMASVTAPVSVVTAIDNDEPYGTTVSAFASLSLEPPMILVSLENTSGILEIVRRSGLFGVNILAAHQADLALHFARRGGDKFAGIDWTESEGSPRLPSVTGWVASRVGQLIVAGDHTIITGDVILADSLSGDPLTYYQRTFGTHTAL